MSEVKIKPQRKMWVVVDKQGYAHAWTINYTKTESTCVFCINYETTWKEALKCGWRCVKVDIIFQPV